MSTWRENLDGLYVVRAKIENKLHEAEAEWETAKRSNDLTIRRNALNNLTAIQNYLNTYDKFHGPAKNHREVC